jgi:hypothetical protein
LPPTSLASKSRQAASPLFGLTNLAALLFIEKLLRGEAA